VAVRLVEVRVSEDLAVVDPLAQVMASPRIAGIMIVSYSVLICPWVSFQ
jgi:hypothetical protein